jgi:uncharacterized membrane protein
VCGVSRDFNAEGRRTRRTRRTRIAKKLENFIGSLLFLLLIIFLLPLRVEGFPQDV